MNTHEKQLYYLNELSDYKIDDAYPDVRDWDVKDAALRNIGKVKYLVVNKTTASVVYLDVEVDSSIITSDHDPYAAELHSGLREYMGEKGENHLIIPIRLVDVNRDKKNVVCAKVDHNTFTGTQRILTGAHRDRDYEDEILQASIGNSIENEHLYEEEHIDNVKRRRNLE